MFEGIKSEIVSMIQNKAIVHLSGSNLPINFMSTILSWSDEGIILSNPVSYHQISAFITSRKFQINAELIKISSTSARPSENGILIPFDKAQFQKTDLRKTSRVYLKENDHYLSFLNPIDSMTKIKKPLVDISETGLSLQNYLETKIFFPGSILRSVDIYADDLLKMTRDLKIVYSRSFMPIQGRRHYQIGAQFL